VEKDFDKLTKIPPSQKLQKKLLIGKLHLFKVVNSNHYPKYRQPDSYKINRNSSEEKCPKPH